MAKDERNIYTIQNDASKGEIKIADEVVAIIAALAARSGRCCFYGRKHHE